MAKRRKTTEQQLADVEYRRNLLRNRVRKEEARRQMLVGIMVLNRARGSGREMYRLLQELDRWLPNSHRDRKLFRDLDSFFRLCGARPYSAERDQGWAFNRRLVPAEPLIDRYGNPIARQAPP
ncbi:hypothetical protein [Halomonas chromatireducens]|uniref:Mobilization protein n=1 Tax=Halomonas chromatireducens TaxID=507626 RepID=A0A125R0D9_9GAMM|nr:hypothetical protein [Halomonas chromatireducens]AMD01778.1 hypothetical protein LOKO_02725 [Halomonas chromatireducens]